MKKNVFTKLLMLFVLSGFLMASDCEGATQSADDKQAQQTKQALQNASAEIGYPAIVNYTELKNFKWILELRDQADLITYTYMHNEMDGSIGQFVGKSIGYGIPAATQFTNPVRTVDTWRANGFLEQLPQADPNGLFMPTSTDATWVILIDPEGKPQPQYIEGKIDVFTWKIK